MSPEELLHAMEMVGEVGPAKVAEDGRPRGITKLLKYNRYAQGNLESPTSPWNESCKARIRAQLMWDADKQIGVYGNHMEFISGDTATLTVGTTAYNLTCTEVAAGTYANAKFSFTCYKDGQADSLDIPFTLIKG